MSTNYILKIDIETKRLADLVLEAFEDEFSLLVLIFLDSVFGLELVELHGVTVLGCIVLRMEHMCAEIEDGLFIDFNGFVFYRG
jgi:hypothetical protein